MTLTTLGKLATTLLLGWTLAGCIDAKVDIDLLSDSTARATMTQVMSADVYSMIKMGADQASSDAPAEDDFCGTGELTENADGTATCVLVEEGKFADLTLDSDEQAIVFTPAGPGLVRIALPTADMKAEIGANEALDEETKKMVEAFFTGHGVTLTFSGAEITESNMTIATDRRSAEETIPFLDLINGTADLPDEYYAIVRAP